MWKIPVITCQIPSLPLIIYTVANSNYIIILRSTRSTDSNIQVISTVTYLIIRIALWGSAWYIISRKSSHYDIMFTKAENWNRGTSLFTSVLPSNIPKGYSRNYIYPEWLEIRIDFSKTHDLTFQMFNSVNFSKKF